MMKDKVEAVVSEPAMIMLLKVLVKPLDKHDAHSKVDFTF